MVVNEVDRRRLEPQPRHRPKEAVPEQLRRGRGRSRIAGTHSSVLLTNALPTFQTDTGRSFSARTASGATPGGYPVHVPITAARAPQPPAPLLTEEVNRQNRRARARLRRSSNIGKTCATTASQRRTGGSRPPLGHFPNPSSLRMSA